MEHKKNEMADIFAKIAIISAKLGAIEKDGYNNFHKFKFIGYEQINAKLRTLLHEVGLVIIPSIVDDVTETFPAEEKVVTRTKLKIDFIIGDTQSGESMVVNGGGMANDSGDKSFGKAFTEAVKRFEMKLFHISSSEDRDPDSESIETPSQKKPVLRFQSDQYKKVVEAIQSGNFGIGDVKKKYFITPEIERHLLKISSSENTDKGE